MDNKLIDKLRKILALTSSPQEGEAQAAAAMLARILQQHNLDIADLEKKGVNTKPGVLEQYHDLGKAAFKWKLTLAEAIAEHYFCFPLIDYENKYVSFVGRPDNVESLVMLYAWLIDQIKRFSAEERKIHAQNTGEHIDPLRWQVGFGEGAAIRLGERLIERREQESSEAGTALVLSAKSEISDYLEGRGMRRIDGQMTAAQKKRQEEWEKQNAEWEKENEIEEARKKKLFGEDPDAYYREFPYEHPDMVAAREAKYQKKLKEERKREERNARRRKGRAVRYMSYDEIRKEDEKELAHRSGSKTANKINLTPFIEGGKEAKRIGNG